VFAVTLISHVLLHNLTLEGVLATMFLWFAVWLGWQYTCWVTNWIGSETPHIRGLIFYSMLLGLAMAAAIPDAYHERGLVFAGVYVAMQVGRTGFVVSRLSADHPLSPNFRRMLGCVSISALFWIAGSVAHGPYRMVLFLTAVLCEYVSPMFGFALPALGRSRASEWTIEGAHLAERCQLFVIVALGEAVLAMGATLSTDAQWSVPIVLAFLSSFVGALAMWWLYFGISSKDATAAITRSLDPGRIGAYFHYIHAILVAGIIATAVGNDLVLADSGEGASTAHTIVFVAGSAIYLLGTATYKKVGRLARRSSAVALIASVRSRDARDRVFPTG
jgi:low temperature requirement protein LtrA